MCVILEEGDVCDTCDEDDIGDGGITRRAKMIEVMMMLATMIKKADIRAGHPQGWLPSPGNPPTHPPLCSLTSE